MKSANSYKKKIFITGATGFVGTGLVENLVQNNHSVIALARKKSDISKLNQFGVEIVFGDIVDKKSMEAAVKNVDVIIHAAADMKSDSPKGEFVTVEGTKNILELYRNSDAKTLIYLSSCSVYDTYSVKKGERINEESSLEKNPEKRGYYSSAKLKAEKLVLEEIKVSKKSIISLRPGIIWGKVDQLFNPMLGISIKNKIFFVFGVGKLPIPIVYLGNLIELINIMVSEAKSSGVYNVLDRGEISKKDFVSRVVKSVYPKAMIFYIPQSLLTFLISIQEFLFRLIGRNPLVTRYRFISSQKFVIYESRKIRDDFTWQEIEFNKAINKMINSR